MKDSVIPSVISTIILAAFITLKLTGVVAWSWLWVLSPIWIPLLLVLAGLGLLKAVN